MADLDTALDEALRRHDPTFYAPDTSEFMRRELAELIDIESAEPGEPVVLDDDKKDFESHHPTDAAVSVVNDDDADGVTGDHPTG